MLRTTTLNISDPNGNATNKVYEFTGELDAATLIFTGRGVVGGITVYTDGTNDAVCTIYDNTAASGKKFSVLCKGTDGWGGIVVPFRVTNGAYATITGTGATYQVLYL